MALRWVRSHLAFLASVADDTGRAAIAGDHCTDFPPLKRMNTTGPTSPPSAPWRKAALPPDPLAISLEYKGNGTQDEHDTGQDGAAPLNTEPTEHVGRKEREHSTWVSKRQEGMIAVAQYQRCVSHRCQTRLQWETRGPAAPAMERSTTLAVNADAAFRSYASMRYVCIARYVSR